MTSPEAERWCVSPRFGLYWHSWGDEFVVYNSGSGNTHLLDVVAAQALKILDRAPANLLELSHEVAALSLIHI